MLRTLQANIGLLAFVVSAGLTLATAYGFHPTADQTAAILGVPNAIGYVVLHFVVPTRAPSTAAGKS